MVATAKKAASSKQNQAPFSLNAACSKVQQHWSAEERMDRAAVAAAAQRQLMSLVLVSEAERLLRGCQTSFAG